jgi:asparagine synthase (glutamine-hydrolysing)
VAGGVGALRQLPGARRSARIRRGLGTLAATNDLDLLMRTYALIGPDLKQRLYQASFSGALTGHPERVVEHFRAEVDGLDPLSQMLYVDTRLWLPDEFLLIADKMSMAASVELRVPFLDEDLVALVESAHPSLKVRRLTRKWLHKQAALKLLPREIVYRKERGWATPMDRWLRHELRDLVRELLLGEGELCSQLFVPDTLQRMITEHEEQTADRTRELFALTSLGLWHRGFVQSGRSVSASLEDAEVASPVLAP